MMRISVNKNFLKEAFSSGQRWPAQTESPFLTGISRREQLTDESQMLVHLFVQQLSGGFVCRGLECAHTHVDIR